MTDIALFQYPVGVADSAGECFIELDLWVDVSRLYNRFPSSLLTGLGYVPDASRSFLLESGEIVELPITSVPIRIHNQVRHVVCVFGYEETPLILGRLALDTFMLKPDPQLKELIPAEVPLLPFRRFADDVT